ncbi:MAG: SDR family NAD(P)-dependent oxidoreductase, partial [Chloroflexi bacterium]|nr:SDR family NAD(P)-dependent oxidoreductase [Chloroflexota bacterium]
MREIEGRTALIIGGGGGIGRGIALALAGEGMRIVVADIEADSAETVAAELAASGAEASAETVDVSDTGAVEALAERCFERHGGVDVLCNNAGVVGHTPIGP